MKLCMYVLYMCVLCMYVCLCVGAYGKSTLQSLSTLLMKGLSGEVELSTAASLATQHAPGLSCVLGLYTELKVDYHTNPAMK